MNGHRMDMIADVAAKAARRAVKKQATYARLRGVSKGQASRDLSGRALNAPAARLLRQFAEADGATAYPLLAEAQAMIYTTQASLCSTNRLWQRLRELVEEEHSAQAEEDRHTVRAAEHASADQLDQCALACIKESEINLERAAILREIAYRLRHPQ